MKLFVSFSILWLKGRMTSSIFLLNKFHEDKILEHVLDKYFWISLFFTLTHIFCFILGKSYDYRLIFLVIGVSSYFSNLKCDFSTYQERIILFLLIISLWFTYPFKYLAPMGDFTLEILSMYMLFILLGRIKIMLSYKPTST